jgi:hypothetical protein
VSKSTDATRSQLAIPPPVTVGLIVAVARWLSTAIVTSVLAAGAIEDVV